MSFNPPPDWNRPMWDRRGRGGRGRGFNRGPRFFRGHNNFSGPPPPPLFNPQGGHWSKWNQDYSGAANRHMNQQWQNKVKRDTPGKRLSEEDIGVTEFVNDHEGFSGIIKSRYSDFQVSEINDDGEVAKLTDLTAPTPPSEMFDEDEDLLLTKYNLEILPMDTWDKINKLVVSKEPVERVEIDVTGMSKEQRTKIHDAVKKAFGNGVVGSTVNAADDKKLVCFDQYRKGVRIDNRVKWIWPGEYVYFIVHKENCDTMEAAMRIAEALHINLRASLLGFAGTKDRRAKTSQWMSARRVDPRKLAAAAQQPSVQRARVRLGNYTFRATPLRLGLLKGNMFRIALRNVTASEECVNAACELLRDRGFINYYGLQRFGTRMDTPTYRIGLSLLQGNFKEAIDNILREYSGTERRSLEALVCQALVRAPRDHLGALQKVPRNTRLLYLHSYQSLVWNRAVTERIKKYGLKPAVGDLVPLATLDKEELEENDSEDEESSDKEEQKSEKEAGTEKPEVEPQKETENKTENKEKKGKKSNIPKPKVPVKILTQEDIDSGNYTIFDIILPLPGFNIDYPPNIKDFYEELLAKDGLKLDLRHKIKSYSLSGTYRVMVARTKEFSWKLVRYSDPRADLVLSDADELDGVELTGVIPDGKYQALLLTMSLPASCYATMALRELLKVDTSGDNQALQNNYHKRKADDEETKEETEQGEAETGNGEKGKEDGTDAKKAKTDDSDKQ